MSKNSITKKGKIIKLQDYLLNVVDDKNIISNQGKVVRSETFPLKHSFVDGVYVRQMGMDKDSAVIGAIHNHEHIWFLLSGNVTIHANDSTQDYIAPCYVKCAPGVKRLIYANENSVFVNIHKNPSNTQDLNKLEAEIVSISYEDYEKYINKNK